MKRCIAFILKIQIDLINSVQKGYRTLQFIEQKRFFCIFKLSVVVLQQTSLYINDLEGSND